MIRLYNTLTKKMEEFRPVEEGKVKMYVCGPTVYNYFHIGNARPFIVFDVIRNYFKYSGYDVTFVQNVTDIEDKIINKANDEGVSWEEIVKRYTDAYFEDIESLNVEKADVSPKATEEIDGMIDMIKTLVEKGNAYVSENGVYFAVDTFEGYGKLSHRNIEELQEGARVEVDGNKKSSLDFALWKFSKPGEPSWKSPWGDGRPGWHIECSVMSSKHLAKTFDIHGGGADLIFPHHENEIAQSEAAHGVTFANYWMHNGYMNIDGEKMSKSKGNFIILRDILKEFSAEVIRTFILSAQYRGPLDFSHENVEKVAKGYREIFYTFQRISQCLSSLPTGEKRPAKSEFIDEFVAAMNSDFNTAKAIAAIYKCVNELKSKMNKISDEEVTEYYLALKEMCDVLKITPAIINIDKSILDLVKQIGILRSEKNYEKADELKKEVTDKGYLLEFSKDFTYVLPEMK